MVLGVDEHLVTSYFHHFHSIGRPSKNSPISVPISLCSPSKLYAPMLETLGAGELLPNAQACVRTRGHGWSYSRRRAMVLRNTTAPSQAISHQKKSSRNQWLGNSFRAETMPSSCGPWKPPLSTCTCGREGHSAAIGCRRLPQSACGTGQSS